MNEYSARVKGEVPVLVSNLEMLGLGKAAAVWWWCFSFLELVLLNLAAAGLCPYRLGIEASMGGWL